MFVTKQCDRIDDAQRVSLAGSHAGCSHPPDEVAAAIGPDGVEAALQRSLTLLKTVGRITGIGGWDWDVVRDMLIWSDEVYRMFGRDPNEWNPTVENFAACIYPEDRRRVHDAITASLTHNAPFDQEFRIVRPDRSVRVVHSRAELTLDRAGRVVAMTGTSHDITERRSAERDLARKNRALRTLSRGNEVVVRANSEIELLDDMCRVIVEAGGYRIAAIGSVEHDMAKTVNFIASAGERARYITGLLNISWDDVPAGRGTTGRAIRSGEAQTSQDLAADADMAPWATLATDHGIASAVSLPLKDRAGVFAILLIYATEPNAFDADELKLLQELANDLSYGISALRERGQNAVLEQRLRRSLEATIGAIASTVEMRDPYTAGHQQRVAKLAVEIARLLGMSEHDIRGIYFAGIIHDVGKIKIPAEILNRPGKLSSLEFSMIQGHVEAGYDIVKGVEFPWPIAQMVRQHHERLDGSGYPDGLQGDAMLLQSKILAVADVVDAMTSHRPYRPALGIEAALSEIETQKGCLFDPAAVDACSTLFRDMGFSFAAAPELCQLP